MVSGDFCEIKMSELASRLDAAQLNNGHSIQVLRLLARLSRGVQDDFHNLPSETKQLAVAYDLAGENNFEAIVEHQVLENLRGIKEYQLSGTISPKHVHFPVIDPLWKAVDERFYAELAEQGGLASKPEHPEPLTEYKLGKLANSVVWVSYNGRSADHIVHAKYTFRKIPKLLDGLIDFVR